MAAERAKGVTVVVGVGEGLGAALARRFAAGYRVALVARSADVIEKVAGEIRAGGGVAVPIQSDATVEAQIVAAHERIRGELGPIDVLVYNGGRRPIGRLLETTPDVFEDTWRLHAFGAFLWARQVVPEMLSRGSGAILITGATAGVQPWPNSAAFGPAKFAVRGLAQVMARDLHPQGIHVAYINVDGAIDMPVVRSFWPDAKDERPAQTGGHRRCVLVSRTPGPKHVDARAGRTAFQGEVLSTRIEAGRKMSPTRRSK